MYNLIHIICNDGELVIFVVNIFIYLITKLALTQIQYINNTKYNMHIKMHKNHEIIIKTYLNMHYAQIKVASIGNDILH